MGTLKHVGDRPKWVGKYVNDPGVVSWFLLLCFSQSWEVRANPQDERACKLK